MVRSMPCTNNSTEGWNEDINRDLFVSWDVVIMKRNKTHYSLKWTLHLWEEMLKRALNSFKVKQLGFSNFVSELKHKKSEQTVFVHGNNLMCPRASLGAINLIKINQNLQYLTWQTQGKRNDTLGLLSSVLEVWCLRHTRRIFNNSSSSLTWSHRRALQFQWSQHEKAGWSTAGIAVECVETNCYPYRSQFGSLLEVSTRTRSDILVSANLVTRGRSYKIYSALKLLDP